MKTICVAICTARLFGHAVFGQDQQSIKAGVESVSVGSLAAYQTAMGRADVAVAKSLLNERILKGEVGEAISDQTVGRQLYQSGKWLNVSPRLGPQGLDHIWVQPDENGIPRRMMVGETKFGSSRLSVTKFAGIQMGSKWISKQLSGLAKRFDTIREQGDFQNAKVPAGLSSRRVVQVSLNDSESVRFWRPAEGAGPWQYDGPAESLPKAVAQLKSQSELFQAGAEGRIDFPKRIFQVKIDGDVLRVNVIDAARLDATGGNLEKLPMKTLEFPLEENVWASDTIKAKIAGGLRQEMPYLDSAESERLAQGIQSTAKTAEDVLTGKSFARFATGQSAEAGAAGVLVVVPIEIAFQLINGGQVDWQRVAGVGVLAGGSAAVGSLAGNVTTYALMQTELGYSASDAAAKILGLGSASRFANVAGGTVGGGATAILFAYGGYWLGYYDLKTANRSAVAGIAGVGAGAVLTAELGGTAVVGSSVLASTGVGIVVIGVTAAVIYGFQVYDKHEDNIRLGETIEYLSTKPTFFIPDAQYDGVSH